MLLNDIRRSEPKQKVAKRSVYAVLGLFFLVISLAVGVSAQQRSNSNQQTTSDLALQNLSRVAASAAEIKVILVKDSGLMVELKHFVAKDATDHGQIVSDSDLTDDAIFERLEIDVQFRSYATSLVRRYGYLLPKLNPDSDLAKEQEMLVKERTKWIAQNEEEELAQARQHENRNNTNSQLCDPQLSENCGLSQTQAREPASGNGRQGNPPEGGPSPTNQPPPQNAPRLPSGGENPLMRAQLGQTGEGAENGPPSQFSTPGPYDSTQSFNNLDVNALQPIGQLNGGTGVGRQSLSGATSLAGGGSNLEGAGDGLLAAFGMGQNVGSTMLPDSGGMNIQDNSNNSNSLGYSRTSYLEMPNRRAQPWPRIQPPEMTRKANPYEAIPSLYDMYVQAVTRPVTPRRFGADVFENGTRDSQLIPMDLPAGPDYVVGPGDGLSVDLWGGVSQRLYRVVDREGRVSLPEVGPVLVSGKSLAEVQQNFQQILKTQFRDVSADVSLARLRTIRVYEVGDVTNPGAYDISSLSTPLNALFSAGGPTSRGSMRILQHYRGTQLVQTVDVYDLLLHGVKKDLERLENGDTVQVPPIGPQVTVEGMVRRPAIYELRDEKTLASVLELAGGLLPTAALRHIEVQRIVAHDRETMMGVDIPDTGDVSEVTKKLESFEIHDGDRVRVYPIVPYNQDTIYVEGHVVRPGRYSYRPDMRVTDVVSSYKDLLPEPATKYAEIILLNAPDFHPTVESFDLGEAFANPAQSPVLHPMDTIQIFSRYDFENPPTVSVLGDVRLPGTYQTSGQIHLADAVHLAGGLTPDAQTLDAQVFRYLPDGKFKIFSVSLGQALGGDPVENIILQPRDRLLIHRNADAVEPASVYIQGEVAKPGRYPLTTNLTVADLIRIGGGLKPSADVQGADLTKYDYSDKSKLASQHEVVALSLALAGDTKSNVNLHNGDVLTIRQLPGWNDLGASITVKGEVKHPGTYGIRPGERLSSVLERAGGFDPNAYPYGAILQRVQVREMELQSQKEVILRVKDAQSSLGVSYQIRMQSKRNQESLRFSNGRRRLTNSAAILLLDGSRFVSLRTLIAGRTPLRTLRLGLETCLSSRSGQVM